MFAKFKGADGQSILVNPDHIILVYSDISGCVVCCQGAIYRKISDTIEEVEKILAPPAVEFVTGTFERTNREEL